MNLTSYSEIQQLLKSEGFRFSKSMGQNFLIADWVPRDIADSALLDENTTVLEIGPGIGCLTYELSKRAGKVVSVELDRSLMPILAQTLKGCENTEVIFGDIMKMELPDADRVCANLPYNITSPVLTKLIKSGKYESITVMIQKEVAKRICAKAGEDDYSAFGIMVQWYTDPEILFDVPPGCFMPQPKVTSSVIRLTKRTERPAQVKDEEQMFRLVRAAFNQRRKTIVNALSAVIDRETAAAAIEKAGLDNKIRGEMLSIGDFAQISDNI